ncbi:MAG: hypothetical protein J1F03_04380 [Oscillospiraceae bacterium]|nr:hypothetical protein [Oscillospiraceae bacterium]
MVNVSEKFKELSMSNGREISCKIVAGGETFSDDRLIEFDFNDVVHQRRFTIGSACASRFTFSVRYSGELEVHDEVRPYISFDGGEWCPLGVFYVARRYVRGKYASIICYDKMYSLETEYVPRIYSPAKIKDILDDICQKHGIVCDANIEASEAVWIPYGSTVREVLGFIAGVACANAKFDREGKLSIKKCPQMNGFILPAKNCMHQSRNMSATKIGRLIVDTGSQIINIGRGGELSTIEIYNPLMTKSRAEDIIGIFSDIPFYGADIEMQGLLFLEAGDCIYMEDEDSNIYPIMVSEIDYHYDGGLTAKLYSKTRYYTEEEAYQDDLRNELEQIRASLGSFCFKSENRFYMPLISDDIEAASFDFETTISGSFAQGDVNFTVDGKGILEIKAYVNDRRLRTAVHEATGEKTIVHFYFLTDELPKGQNNVYVTIRAVDGIMSIDSGRLTAVLVCRGTAGKTLISNL